MMRSDYQRLNLHRTGPGDSVLWLSLYNPAMRNALDARMQDELLEVFHHITTDDSIRVVILRGDGDTAFCSGGDISVFDGMTPLKGEWYATHRGQAIFKAIQATQKPVIAAVDGYCLAGGTEIALMCDFSYTTQKARFGLPEINIGLLPGWGGTVRLPAAIGPRRAKEMIMRGEIISGQDAVDFGLANRVFDNADAMYTAIDATAAEIALKSKVAVRLARSTIDQSLDCASDEAAFALERGACAILVSHDDAKEGVAAFLEKRKPEFS